jgi:hypothetical protein
VPGEHVTGYVENLSRLGIFVRCEQNTSVRSVPELGEEFEIDIELPSHPARLRQRSLHCFATVVRQALGNDGECCLAASISELHFRDLPLEFRFPQAVGGVAEVV